jgi:hypothetical protein
VVGGDAEVVPAGVGLGAGPFRGLRVADGVTSQHQAYRRVGELGDGEDDLGDLATPWSAGTPATHRRQVVIDAVQALLAERP